MINRILRKIRRIFAPTMQDKWRAADGDSKLRLDYPLTRESLVLDFGGFEGQWAADIHARYGCRIVVFEPVAAFADQIRRRFSGNPLIEVCGFGLGLGNRSEQICLAADGSSLFAERGSHETIEIRDAADWLEDRGNPRVALAKVNIEGAEYELLERLIEAGRIPSIDNIQVQFHPIAPDSRARMSAIQAQLARTHDIQWQYDFVWESWAIKGNSSDQ